MPVRVGLRRGRVPVDSSAEEQLWRIKLEGPWKIRVTDYRRRESVRHLLLRHPN
jgi:hypothetical protein